MLGRMGRVLVTSLVLMTVGCTSPPPAEQSLPRTEPEEPLHLTMPRDMAFCEGCG